MRTSSPPRRCAHRAKSPHKNNIQPQRTITHRSTAPLSKRRKHSFQANRSFSSDSNSIPLTKKNNISVHKLRLPRLSPLAMLHIEERLLRHDPLNRNFVVYNRPLEQHRSIILGISGKPEHTVNLDTTQQDNIPMIRRYTGGGTVYITPSIRFLGIVMNKDDIVPFSPFPVGVMDWTSLIYADFIADMQRHSSTTISTTQQSTNNENLQYVLNAQDYCLGQRKFAGNAQVLSRTRFCHHTSVLWDLETDAITKYLSLPQRRPEYRADRKHSDFLIGLRSHFYPDIPDDDFHADIAENQQNTLGGCEYTKIWMDAAANIKAHVEQAEAYISQHVTEMTAKAHAEGVSPETYLMSLPEQRAYVAASIPEVPAVVPNVYAHAMQQQQQIMQCHQAFGVDTIYDLFEQHMDTALNQHFNVIDITLDDVRDIIEPYDRKLNSYVI